MKLRYLFAILPLAACAHPGQNRYGFQDVGKPTAVSFGTVITSRPVEITGQNTGTGAAVGLGAGAAAGSAFGSGNGQLGAVLAGALIGAIAGGMTEQAMQDRTGIEYTVTLENGKTLTIVQNIHEDGKPLRKGQRVMVQESGAYSRVLPADDMPTKIKRPKKIAVED